MSCLACPVQGWPPSSKQGIAATGEDLEDGVEAASYHVGLAIDGENEALLHGITLAQEAVPCKGEERIMVGNVPTKTRC